MSFNKVIRATILLVLLGVSVYVIFSLFNRHDDWCDTFDDVKNTAAPVYTNQESVTNTAAVSIHVINPVDNALVVSPLHFSGTARGSWFFEASFPVVLKDNAGNVIGSGIAQAQSDWMTEDFVQFAGVLTFADPPTSDGTLVFTQDNPADLPGAQTISVPVQFSQ